MRPSQNQEIDIKGTKKVRYEAYLPARYLVRAFQTIKSDFYA